MINNRRIIVWRGIHSLSLDINLDSIDITEKPIKSEQKKTLLRYESNYGEEILSRKKATQSLKKMYDNIFLSNLLRHAIRHTIEAVSGTLSGTLSGTHNNSSNTPGNIFLILQFNIVKTFFKQEGKNNHNE